MRASIRRKTTRTGPRPALILALAAVLGSCGDNPITRDPGDVNGTWVLADEKPDAVYLSITAATIETWVEDEIAGCFDRTSYEVLETDGGDFRVASARDTLTIELRRDGDDLIVSVFGESEVYHPTNENPVSLTVCGPVNPGVVCTELPEIVAGDVPLEGTLSDTDPTNPDGSHRDLYRLEITTQPAVVIDMSSTEVDSYLVLHEADGEVHSANDDRSSLTFDARLTPTGLAAGCYIISATSAAAAEVGDYTLRVTIPD